MKFKIVEGRGRISNSDSNAVYLEIDHWNDYSFVTQFWISMYDSANRRTTIGAVKIGFVGQTADEATHSVLSTEFPSLDTHFFSVGQGVDFYKNMAKLPLEVRNEILLRLRDIVLNPDIIDDIQDEDVFSVSLLRYVSLSMVRGQFQRVLVGAAELTDFNFEFWSQGRGSHGDVKLNFEVVVDSTPSTNIHAVIGRNGVGKTTLLNGMIDAITRPTKSSKFFDRSLKGNREIDDDYFSRLVSVSFSAFDPFNPPMDQPDPAKGTCYFYIGLKQSNDPEKHRTISDLRLDCVRSLASCFQDAAKTRRWHSAIEKLGSDENFAAMNLQSLEAVYSKVAALDSIGQSDSIEFLKRYGEEIKKYLSKMSSGHAIVLLTITSLVDKVQEKTLVLIDEPEGHLHPPLLSAFVRALSDLLHEQNGVAVIATHSPVVLQEIPKSCVWKLYRNGLSVSAERPGIETFAENVGRLTSEVFSLEVGRSGFHALLEASVNRGDSVDKIMDEYNGKIGLEGRAILIALITDRDAGRSK